MGPPLSHWTIRSTKARWIDMRRSSILFQKTSTIPCLASTITQSPKMSYWKHWWPMAGSTLTWTTWTCFSLSRTKKYRALWWINRRKNPHLLNQSTNSQPCQKLEHRPKPRELKSSLKNERLRISRLKDRVAKVLSSPRRTEDLVTRSWFNRSHKTPIIND